MDMPARVSLAVFTVYRFYERYIVFHVMNLTNKFRLVFSLDPCFRYG